MGWVRAPHFCHRRFSPLFGINGRGEGAGVCFWETDPGWWGAIVLVKKPTGAFGWRLPPLRHWSLPLLPSGGSESPVQITFPPISHPLSRQIAPQSISRPPRSFPPTSHDPIPTHFIPSTFARPAQLSQGSTADTGRSRQRRIHPRGCNARPQAPPGKCLTLSFK